MSLTDLIPWPYRLLAIALLALACYGTGQLHGRNSVQADWDEEKAKQGAIAAKVIIKQGEATIKVVTEYVDRVKVIHDKGATITKEIPVYVKADDCPMSGGFRLLHDAAALNTVPDAASIADASPVAAQDVAEVVTDNYTQCNATSEQLISLQSWVRAQQEASKP